MEKILIRNARLVFPGQPVNGQVSDILIENGRVSRTGTNLDADGARAFVGSENLTANSLNNNREVGILLDDAILVGKLASTAAQDWVPAPAAAPAPTVENP